MADCGGRSWVHFSLQCNAIFYTNAIIDLNTSEKYNSIDGTFLSVARVHFSENLHCLIHCFLFSQRCNAMKYTFPTVTPQSSVGTIAICCYSYQMIFYLKIANCRILVGCIKMQPLSIDSLHSSQLY